MSITDRYATAIRSSNLKHDDRSVNADTDVLGAFGIADRRLSFHGHPLSVPLTRLFMGDNGAAAEIVEVLAVMARGKAPALRTDVTETQATDMARACLAWHRDSCCKVCGGHGQFVIKGSTTIGGAICKVCKGTGKILFEKNFRHEWHELARWLVSEMDREQGRSGPEAMKALGRQMDFGTTG
ncbi:MAG: hypothetical protein ACRYGA_02290 [Janthinobacterium lividum]